MQIVWGDVNNPERNRLLAEWCATKLGHSLSGPYSSMGVVDNDLIAVVVYHDWDKQHGTMQMSAASTSARWLTRPVLREMFDYPFGQLGNQLVALRVSERNERMIGILPRFGFKGYPIPRLRGRDEGEIIFTLTDDDWLRHPIRQRHG